uniref:RNA-binding protein n=1 Tax=Meloidogyne hapla TaxID=6305 RepID=A0A1I8B9Z1_MELHA
QVLEEPFIVDQSSIFQQNTIIELISKTSPNHLNVLEARNIVFAGFKCLNGEAFVIVLRTREETVSIYKNTKIRILH